MHNYKLLTTLTLRDGVVRLTQAQIKGRAHKLEAVAGKKDIYRITGENQFKAGQEIGYEGELPKVIAELIADATEAKRGAVYEKAAKKIKEKPETEKAADEAAATRSSPTPDIDNVT